VGFNPDLSAICGVVNGHTAGATLSKFSFIDFVHRVAPWRYGSGIFFSSWGRVGVGLGGGVRPLLS